MGKNSLLAYLRQQLQPYIKDLTGGDAGFYFYISLDNIETGKHSMFYKFLTRTTGNKEIDGFPEPKPRLIYIPGEICGNAANSKFSFRLSYGYESIEVFTRAINLIKEACEYSVQTAGYKIDKKN